VLPVLPLFYCTLLSANYKCYFLCLPPTTTRSSVPGTTSSNPQSHYILCLPPTTTRSSVPGTTSSNPQSHVSKLTKRSIFNHPPDSPRPQLHILHYTQFYIPPVGIECTTSSRRHTGTDPRPILAPLRCSCMLVFRQYNGPESNQFHTEDITYPGRI